MAQEGGQTLTEEQVEALFQRADTMMLQESQFTSAIPLYQQIVAAEPDNAQAYNSLFYCYKKQKKFDKAKEVLETAAEKDPDDFETFFNLGVFLMDNDKNYDKALEALKKCQDLESSDPKDKTKVLYNIAKTYELKNDSESALKFYDQVLERDDGDYRAMVNRSVLLEKRGERSEALKNMERAATIKGNNSKILNNFGVLKKREGDIQSSAKMFKMAIKIDALSSNESTESDVVEDDIHNLASGDEGAKKEENKVAGSLMPGDFLRKDSEIIYLNRALLMYESGNENKAQKYLKEAFERIKAKKNYTRLGMTQSDLRTQLATISMSSKNYTQALVFLREELKANPNSQQVIEMIAKCESCLKAEQEQEAKEDEKLDAQIEEKTHQTEPPEESDPLPMKEEEEVGKGQPEEVHSVKKSVTTAKSFKEDADLAKSESIRSDPESDDKVGGQDTDLKTMRTGVMRSQTTSKSVFMRQATGQQQDDIDRSPKMGNPVPIPEAAHEDSFGGSGLATEFSKADSFRRQETNKPEQSKFQKQKTALEANTDRGEIEGQMPKLSDQKSEITDVTQQQMNSHAVEVDSKIGIFNEGSVAKQESSVTAPLQAAREEFKHEEEKVDKVPPLKVHKSDTLRGNIESHATLTTNMEIKAYEPAPIDDEPYTQREMRLPTDISLQEKYLAEQIPSDLEAESALWSPRTCQYKLNIDPKHLFARYRLAQHEIDLGNEERGVAHLEALSAVSPYFKLKHVLQLKIKSYDKLEKLENSLDLFDQLLAIVGRAYKTNKSSPKALWELFETFFQRGKCLERMMNFKKAVLSYIQCHKLDDNVPKVYLRLAQCYKKSNKFKEAADALNRAVQLEFRNELSTEESKKNYIDHLLNLAVIQYHNLSNFPEAIKSAKKVLRYDPNNGSALVILGRIAEKQNELEISLEYFTKASTVKTHAPECQYRVGKIQEKLGNKKLALKAYKQSLAIQPEHFECCMALAGLLSGEQEYHRSLRYYKFSCQLKKDNCDGMLGCATVLYKLGMNAQLGKQKTGGKDVHSSSSSITEMNPAAYIDNAMKYLKRCIQVDPNYAPAHRLTGEVFLDKKQYDKAQQKLQDARKLDPYDSENLYLLGRYYQEIGNVERGIKYYNKCLAINTNQEQALVKLGNAMYEAKKFQEANKCFEKVLEMDKNSSNMHYCIGNSYFCMQKYDQACIHYTRAAEIDPFNADYYYNLGNSYSMKEDQEKAIKMYSKALEYDPKNSAALYNMGNSYHNMNKFAEAIEAYHKSLEIKDDNAEAHFNLANSYQELKDFKKACFHFRQSIQYDGNTEDAYFQLGNLYSVELNDKEKAIKVYEGLLKIFPNNKRAEEELAKL